MMNDDADDNDNADADKFSMMINIPMTMNILMTNINKLQYCINKSNWSF